MPEISRFYGLVVTMYPEAGERHSTPHFHARYGGSRATIAIESGEVLAGSLSKPQLRLIQAWVELRRMQLDADWNLLVAGNAPDKIAPLT